jgi:hypothetical protein
MSSDVSNQNQKTNNRILQSVEVVLLNANSSESTGTQNLIFNTGTIVLRIYVILQITWQIPDSVIDLQLNICTVSQLISATPGITFGNTFGIGVHISNGPLINGSKDITSDIVRILVIHLLIGFYQTKTIICLDASNL